MLAKSFKKCSQDVKNYLFRAYCSSTYGCPLWNSYKASDYKKAIVAYNDVYRSLFSIKRGESMSHIFVMQKINHLNVLRRKSIFSFRERLLISDNQLIRTIVNSLFYRVSSMTCKWRQLYIHDQHINVYVCVNNFIYGFLNLKINKQ